MVYETREQSIKFFPFVYASLPCLLQEHSSACVSNSGLGCVAVGSSVTVLAEGLTRVQSAFTTGKETARSREMSVSLMAQQFFGTFERSNWRPFLGLPSLVVFKHQTAPSLGRSGL